MHTQRRPHRHDHGIHTSTHPQRFTHSSSHAFIHHPIIHASTSIHASTHPYTHPSTHSCHVTRLSMHERSHHVHPFIHLSSIAGDVIECMVSGTPSYRAQESLTGKHTSAVERSCNRMHAHIRASANAGTHRHTHTHTRTQHTHMANEIGESRERELMGAEVGARNAGKGCASIVWRSIAIYLGGNCRSYLC